MKNFLNTTLSVIALTAVSFAAQAETKTRQESEYTAVVSKSIKTEAEFRMAMSGPGSLSLAESKLAESKATNAKVMEFAKFETAEQSALATILKELKTPEHEMTEQDKATMKKLKDASKGAEFDKAYIEAQIQGHEMLKSITGSYLKNGDFSTSDPKEMEARHLALFADQAIVQHIANTKEIHTMLK